MLSTERVNGNTKKQYFAQKCSKIRFCDHAHYKNTILSKKGFLCVLLTLRVRVPDISGPARWKIHHIHMKS